MPSLATETSLDPECLENPTATAREILRDGTDRVRNTQAVCGFRCWASKLAPLFHTINAMVAIFLAKVSRAISAVCPGQQSGVLIKLDFHLTVSPRVDFS